MTQKRIGDKPHNRIRDWRGLLADESRQTRVGIAAVIVLVSASMTFMQFGFIGVGTNGDYLTYVLGLLGPISIAALLLGRGWGTLCGLLCGMVLLVHAYLQPLDLYERYFVSPLNSVALYATTGLALGLLFSIVLRNDPRGVKRVIYMGVVCLFVAYLASILFSVNAVIDAVYRSVATEEMQGNIPRDTIIALDGMGDFDLQVILDFVAMLALCLVTDQLVYRHMDARSHMSVLSIFRTQLLVITILVFLVVQSAAFVVITRRLEQSAESRMNATIDSVCDQLKAQDQFIDKLLQAPELENISNDLFSSILERVSMEQITNGYNVDDDGTVVVVMEDMVMTSNSPAYPPGITMKELYGEDNENYLYELAKSDKAQKTLYSTRPHEELEKSLSEAVNDPSFDLQLGYACARKTSDYLIMAALPSSIVFKERSTTTAWASMLTFVLLLAIYIIAAQLLRRVMVEPIVRTNQTLAKITAGNLDEPVSEVGSVELAMLSAGINVTVDSLKELISEAERRNERDLATAKTIQESALPRTFPPFPDIDAFDIYATMNAAKEVGGDFYDFFLIDDHTLCFLIADVSGKGIPGALFMMAAKTELENYFSTGMPPAEAIASANKRLCANNDAGMFVTVWAATLNWKTGELTYVNAGHNFPLLRKGVGGSWEWFKKRCGLFLGTFETAKYRQETLTLEPGDELLLYTDGVNEAFNEAEEEYGNDRLEAFLMAHNDSCAQDLVHALRADVAAWAGKAEQSDDVTILALEYGASSEATGGVTVPATLDHLGEVSHMIAEELEKRLCPQSVQHKVIVALEEMFVNVCHYAYATQDSPGEVTVSYTYRTDPSTIAIELRDSGIPFDPVQRKDPTKPASIQEAKIGGLGIFIVKKTMDELSYRREEQYNVVSFSKSW
ncbi:MAG: SpoIIE family protein phosphatase [Atopobiaceae bacterium]|nr:SpoIIE family protein phosphatase [Atopobiaceae bacterium]